jgi:hypothetical protein
MNTHLDELYLTWLYSQIGSVNLKNPSRTHWSLAKQLYTKEFLWFIPNDDNRSADGKDLRYEFLEVADLEELDPIWLGLPCSMLEMMIALTRHLSFQAEGEPHDWFWQLIENLDIPPCDDRLYNDDLHDEIEDILDRVIWRTYDSNGNGGLFPMQSADKDQRKVEIWYQLSAYLMPDI